MSDNRWEMPGYEAQLVREEPLEDKLLGGVLVVEPHQRAIITVGGKPKKVRGGKILEPGRHSLGIFEKWQGVRCRLVDMRRGSFPVKIEKEIMLGTIMTEGVSVEEFEAVVSYEVADAYELAFRAREPLTQVFNSIKMVFSDVVTQMSYEQIRQISKAELGKQILAEVPVRQLEVETGLRVYDVKVTGFAVSGHATRILEEGWGSKIKAERTDFSPSFWELTDTQLVQLMQDEHWRKERAIEIFKTPLWRSQIGLPEDASQQQEIDKLLEIIRPSLLHRPEQPGLARLPMERVASKSSVSPRSREAVDLWQEYDLLVQEVGQGRVESRPGPDDSRTFFLCLAEPDGNYPLEVSIVCPPDYPHAMPKITIKVIEEEGRVDHFPLEDRWTEQTRLIDIVRRIKSQYDVQ